jgi:hypothetical protein
MPMWRLVVNAVLSTALVCTKSGLACTAMNGSIDAT